MDSRGDADNCPDPDPLVNCYVCLESPPDVAPFQCKHTVCARCTALLFNQGRSTCPVCASAWRKMCPAPSFEYGSVRTAIDLFPMPNLYVCATDLTELFESRKLRRALADCAENMDINIKTCPNQNACRGSGDLCRCEYSRFWSRVFELAMLVAVLDRLDALEPPPSPPPSPPPPSHQLLRANANHASRVAAYHFLEKALNNATLRVPPSAHHELVYTRRPVLRPSTGAAAHGRANANANANANSLVDTAEDERCDFRHIDGPGLQQAVGEVLYMAAGAALSILEQTGDGFPGETRKSQLLTNLAKMFRDSNYPPQTAFQTRVRQKVQLYQNRRIENTNAVDLTRD